MADLNDMAKCLKNLHQPGNPIVFANVYDAVSAEVVGQLPNCRAMATASFAVAAVAGLEDDDLDAATNINAVRVIGRVAKRVGIPLTADIQDGYGDDLENVIEQVIEAGAVGVNIEDSVKGGKKMQTPEEAAQRVARVLEVAKNKGVSDFVVNARSDGLLLDEPLEKVIERGRLYLKAGATCFFVWGGPKRGGISREEVVRLSDELKGWVSVIMKIPRGTGLQVDDLAKIGICRISVGPALLRLSKEFYALEAKKILG